MSIAIGSVTEVENHVQRGFDGDVITNAEHHEMTAAAIEVRRMLIGLRKALRGEPRAPRLTPPGPSSES